MASGAHRALRKKRWKLVWCFSPTAPEARSTPVTVCRSRQRSQPATMCWNVTNEGAVKQTAKVLTSGMTEGARAGSMSVALRLLVALVDRAAQKRVTGSVGSELPRTVGA
jgi:hypothetical protein